MATAWIDVEAFDSLPGVCAKTGEATDVRMPVTAEYVPPCSCGLQLFGVWSFLFAHSAGSRGARCVSRSARGPSAATAPGS